MKLGLKRGHGVAANVNRALLRTRYSHSAMLHDGILMEATALKGRHSTAGVRSYVPTPFEVSEFVWFDVPDHLVDHALAVFKQLEGHGYDYCGLLSFFPLFRVGDQSREYCHELMALMLGAPEYWWYTPEILLEHLLNETSKDTSTLSGAY